MRHPAAAGVLLCLLLCSQPAPADTVHICVHSELWPDETSALDEANHRLFDKLLAVASAQSGESLSRKEIRRSLPRLVTAREVRREEVTEKFVKPYGVMFQQHIAVRISDEIVAHWVADTVRERQVRLHQRVGAGALTLLGCLFGLWAVFKLDRWTNGYRRGVILGSTFGVVTVLTGYLWLVLPDW